MSGFSQRQIEEFAIARLKDTLLAIDCIDVEIASNDKTPSWDGEIYLYSGKRHSKDTMVGRMPVQVKGKGVLRLSVDFSKHDIILTDINNYKNDQGCIYFVVEIDKNDSSKRKVFYNVIDPYKAWRILKDSNMSSKTRRLKFLELPEDQRQIVDIIRTALRFKDDRFYIDKEPPRFFANEIRFETADRALRDGSSVLLNFEEATTRLYQVDVNGYTIPVDFDELIVQQFTVGEEKIIHGSVAINGRTFFHEFGVTILPSKHNEEVLRFRFGDLLSITLRTACEVGHIAQTVNFKVEAAEKLSNTVDLEFIQAFRQFHAISCESYFWRFPSMQDSLPDNSHRINALKRIIAILNSLNISYDDARIADFDHNSDADIDTLFLALVEGKSYTPINKPPKTQEVGIARFGPHDIALFWRLLDDGTISMLDFFSPGKMAGYAYDRDTQEVIAVPVYRGLRAIDYVRISNLHLDAMVAEFQDYPVKPLLLETADAVISELLKASDLDTKRQAEFLSVATDLLNWVEGHGHYGEIEAQLKSLQIARRKGSLTRTEKKKLESIAKALDPHGSEGTELYYLLVVSLLLGNSDDARAYYSRLTPQQRKTFRAGTAFHFWEAMARGHFKSIVDLANSSGGYVTTREVDDYGFSRTMLSRLTGNGKLVKVDEGLYAVPEVIADDPFFVLQNRFSKGIFSLGTALYLLDLSDRTPIGFDMAFPHGYNSKTIKANEVQATYEISKFYGKGAVKIETPYGNSVVAYCAERTLCDIVRGKNHMDASIVTSAFREYLNKSDKNINELMFFAGLLNVAGLIESYLEILA
jgi:hypothetical protein